MSSTKRVVINTDEKGNVISSTIEESGNGYSTYFLIHFIVFLVSLYMSYKCNNNEITILGFLGSLFIPYLYILYLAVFHKFCFMK